MTPLPLPREERRMLLGPSAAEPKPRVTIWTMAGSTRSSNWRLKPRRAGEGWLKRGKVRARRAGTRNMP